MATQKLPRTYKEANPLDKDCQAMRWMLTAVELRRELYSYLRNLTNERGEPGDVSARTAEEIARYTTQRVVMSEGFSREEAAHINGQLEHLNNLRLKAYPLLHS